MITEVSALEVGHAYLDLHNRMRRMIDDAMTEAGVSLSRTKVLGQLAEHGPVNQSALAGRLGFAPRSVTDTVDALGWSR
jgi:DNA-binding MarR family transcriptional regulator